MFMTSYDELRHDRRRMHNCLGREPPCQPLKASEFNDVASQYLERPAFLSIQSFFDDNTALKVLMDECETGYSATLGVVTEHATYFDQRFVPTYLALIDKYLEWEALARERGDLIEREIGSTKPWG